MLTEKNYLSKKDLITNISSDLKTAGFVSYKQNTYIFDLFTGKEKFLNDKSSPYCKLLSQLKKNFPDPSLFPNLSRVNKPYFIVNINGKSIKNTFKEEDYFFDSLEDVLGVLKESIVEIYPTRFYKFITEQPLWDVSSEEIYADDAKFEEFYQEFLKEIDLTITKLRNLKKARKEDSSEFTALVLKLDDLAPELATEFKEN